MLCHSSIAGHAVLLGYGTSCWAAGSVTYRRVVVLSSF
jgi:hypothetical protein